MLLAGCRKGRRNALKGVLNLPISTEKIPLNLRKVWPVIKDKNGNQNIKLAPVFDSEAALMLDMSKSTIEKLLLDYEGLMQAVGNAYPKIAVGLSREDGGLGEYWADTMDRIIDDDTAHHHNSNHGHYVQPRTTYPQGQ